MNTETTEANITDATSTISTEQTSTSTTTPSTVQTSTTTISTVQTSTTTTISTQTSTTTHPSWSSTTTAPANVINDIAGEKYRFRIPGVDKKPQLFKYDVRLPRGVTCDRCVLQWTYVTGNTWGYCEDGTADVGCGPQEWFRNCADIEIQTMKGLKNYKQPVGRGTVYHETSEGVMEPLVVDAIVCVARNESSRTQEEDDTCQHSCLRYPPQCDRSRCKCLAWCEAIGELAGIEGTDTYCNMNCLRYPSNCPADKYRCYE